MLNDDFAIDILISNTLVDYASKPKDWRYYFIKYEVMRNYDNSSGFYTWENNSGILYQITKLRRTNFRGFYWNAFLLCLWKSNKNMVSLGDYGDPLIIKKHNLKMSCVDN